MIVCDYCGWRGSGEHDCASNLLDKLIAAYQQLDRLWRTTGLCPCGARRRSLQTHPHVIDCPTDTAVATLTRPIADAPTEEPTR